MLFSIFHFFLCGNVFLVVLYKMRCALCLPRRHELNLIWNSMFTSCTVLALTVNFWPVFFAVANSDYNLLKHNFLGKWNFTWINLIANFVELAMHTVHNQLSFKEEPLHVIFILEFKSFWSNLFIYFLNSLFPLFRVMGVRAQDQGRKTGMGRCQYTSGLTFTPYGTLI